MKRLLVVTLTVLAHNSEVPSDPCYIDGELIDKNDYFGKLTAAIGYTG